MSPLILPPKLKPGNLIGVVAPAGPVDQSSLFDGLERLTAAGFRVRVSPHLYDRTGYLAGEDEDRLGDLQGMFLDADIQGILCARGGYGCLRLLDRLPYPLIRKHPKVVVGFSDITALLLAVHAKTGLVTFHGPTLRDLASKSPANLDHLVRLVSGEQPLNRVIRLRGKSVTPGVAKGPLLGGNLSLICHLTGTPYLPRLDECILIIEETGEALYRLDRMLTHLRLAGCLQRLAGIAVGDMTECGDPSHIEELIGERLAPLGIPVATGFPVGHGWMNLAFPIGISAEMDTFAMTLSFEERWTAEK